MVPNNINVSKINRFSKEVEEEGARSLGLLREIENTISAVNRLTAQLNSDASFAGKLIDIIKKFDDYEIDPDDAISSNLEKAQNIVHNLYLDLMKRRESGRKDARLLEDDGIEQAYTEAIEASADLQNNLIDLRWHILENDAELSASSKKFTNVDDLISDLMA